MSLKSFPPLNNLSSAIFSSLWARKCVCGERCWYLCKWWPSQRWIPRCSPWRTMPLAKKSTESLNPLYFTSSCTEDYKQFKFEYGYLRLLSTPSLPHCPGYGQWVAFQLRSGIQRLSTGTRNFTITISHSEAEILVDSLHRDWTLTDASAVQL